MATKSKGDEIARTALAFQGVAAIIFGIAAVFWPEITTLVLVYLLAAFLLVDGVVVLVWGLLRLNDFLAALLVILLGLIEIGAGLFLMRNPGVALATLLIILGFVIIVRGVMSFIHMFTGKDLPSVKAMHGILGFLGVAIGIIILVQPIASGLAFVWILGLYALIAGAIMVAMSAAVANGK